MDSRRGLRGGDSSGHRAAPPPRARRLRGWRVSARVVGPLRARPPPPRLRAPRRPRARPVRRAPAPGPSSRPAAPAPRPPRPAPARGPRRAADGTWAGGWRRRAAEGAEAPRRGLASRAPPPGAAPARGGDPAGALQTSGPAAAALAARSVPGPAGGPALSGAMR